MSGVSIAALGLALGALAPAAPAAAQDAGAAPAFSVAPDADGWIRLTDAVQALERATGAAVRVDADTARRLETIRLYASGPIECGADGAERAFGAILAAQDFVHTVVHAGPPRVLALVSLDTFARGTVRESAWYVPLEELGRFAHSPGLLVETLLPLPHMDARVLSNSLRSVVVDPNLLQITPAGDAPALVLRGFGPTLADLADMLLAADRASSEEEPRPPVLHGASGEHTVPSPAVGPAVLRDDAAAMTMLDLVRMHAHATGQVALANPETARLLELQPVPLDAPVTVSGDAFPTLCEELLAAQGFVLTDLVHGGPCVYQVESLYTVARVLVRMDARYVDVASVELCERRPATLFQTVVTLPHTDVRTLSNSMRSMVVDPNTFQAIPLGRSHSMILQGFGRQLADQVRMLRRVDAANAEAAESATDELGR